MQGSRIQEAKGPSEKTPAAAAPSPSTPAPLGPSDPVSVHLCDYPVADDALLDADITPFVPLYHFDLYRLERAEDDED